MNLSAHFTFEELTVTEHRAFVAENRRYGEEDCLNNLKRIAALLEEVRAILESPIHINSGVRCPGLNAAVGGSKTSAHMVGLAADFTCRGFGSPYDVAKAIEESDIVFDQLIYEFGAWVHISVAGDACRQALSIHSAKQGYVPGITLGGEGI